MAKKKAYRRVVEYCGDDPTIHLLEVGAPAAVCGLNPSPAEGGGKWLGTLEKVNCKKCRTKFKAKQKRKPG